MRASTLTKLAHGSLSLLKTTCILISGHGQKNIMLLVLS